MRYWGWLLALACSVVTAGEADVLDAEVSCNAARICTIAATVVHEDDGWDHYANRWDVLTTAGELLATRELLHPHDDEQPFTRSLTGIPIPAGVDEVIVRAHDSVHGYGGRAFRVAVEGG